MPSRLALLANHIAFGWGLPRVHFEVFEAGLHAAELFENGCSGDALGTLVQNGNRARKGESPHSCTVHPLAENRCIHWILRL